MSGKTLLKLAAIGAGGYWLSRQLTPPSYQFAGKVAIITGGSRGLGLELARGLAVAGASLALCARDPDELDTARRELEAGGAAVLSMPCDVTDSAAVDQFVAAVRSRFGRIDVLINNAGIIEVTPQAFMSAEDIERSLDVHLRGPLYTITAALPDLKASRGRIVNIASIGGRVPVPHLLPYDIGKFALVGYSEGLSAELAKDGVIVTTVCPGVMRTGSTIQADIKGQHEREYRWFALLSGMPGVTIDSTAAAARILDACARGRRELIFPLPAKAAAVFHDLFRDTSLRLLGQANRLLPSAAGGSGAIKKGRDAESLLTRSPLTFLNRAAAVRNNET